MQPRPPRLRAFLSYACSLALLLIAFAWLRHDSLHRAPTHAVLEVEMRSDHPDTIQLYYNLGEGLSEEHSSRAPISSSPEFQTITLEIHGNPIIGLRLDPGSREGVMEIRHASIHGDGVAQAYAIPLDDLHPSNQIDAWNIQGNALHIHAVKDCNDPNIDVTLPKPLDYSGLSLRRFRHELILASAIVLLALLAFPLKASLAEIPLGAGPLLGLIVSGLVLPLPLKLLPWVTTPYWVLACLLLGCLGLLHLWIPLARPGLKTLQTWAGTHPLCTLSLTALLCTLLSLQAILFQGLSFLSTDTGIILVYSESPTVPGIKPGPVADTRGADIGAMFWQHLPYVDAQHRALLDNHELPLWNRSASCGIPLLGQGQSMFGDPLHWPFVLLGADAWTLDLKFVLYRFLFVFAVGLLVWLFCGQLGPAALTCLGASLLGFFNYRFNHPAIFSLCVAPWVLVGWTLLAKVRSTRARWRACVLLGLATPSLLLSGTVKEACFLSLFLHATGLGLLLFSGPEPFRERLPKLWLACLALFAGLLMALPTLHEFARCLPQSFTYSNATHLWRAPAFYLPGWFDDLLYRKLTAGRLSFLPSLNLLLACGVVMALCFQRSLRPRSIFFWIILFLGFSILLGHENIPESWLLKVPGLRNLGYLHSLSNTAACVFGALLAGIGYARAWEFWEREDQQLALRLLASFLLLITLLYWMIYYTVDGSLGLNLSPWTSEWNRHRDIYLYLAAELSGLILFILSLLLKRWRYLSTAVFIMSFGLFSYIALERHIPCAQGDSFHAVFGQRHQLRNSSTSLQWLRAATASTPGRVLGMENELIGNTHGLYKLEGINSPDALIPHYYRKLLDASGLLKVGGDWRMHPDSASIELMLPILRFLNVRYIVGKRSQTTTIQDCPSVQVGDLTINSVTNAWPRAFFTNKVFYYDTSAQLLRFIQKEGDQPFAAFQFSSEGYAEEFALSPRKNSPSSFSKDTGPTSSQEQDSRLSISANSYKLGTNSTEFDIDCPSTGFVVLQEGWIDGGFVAKVDGEQVPTLRANHAFKAVKIANAGHHHVSFTYRPSSMRLDLGISLCSLLTLLIIGVCTFTIPPFHRT